jgi:two-component system chemotaxis sensor kinase CheA
MSGIEKGIELFKDEAQVLFGELETSLLELEENPADSELIENVFRALHTIKGSGAMFGFDEISRFTHEVETVFDLVRSGDISVTKELVSLALAALDHIRGMLDSMEGGGSAEGSGSDEIVESFRKLIPRTQVVKETVKPVREEVPAGENTVYRIRFRPAPDIFKKGTNPILLLNELRGLGECTVVPHTDEIPAFSKLKPERCYTYWDIILTTDKGENAIRDVFIFVEDDCELKVEAIAGAGSLGEDDYKRIGEILVERGDLREEDLQKVLKTKKLIGEILVDNELTSTNEVQSALIEQQQASALIEQQQAREAIMRRRRTEGASSIRVPSDRLDKLVNLVGELVTIQARLSQTAATKGDPELLLISEVVERLTDELRDSTMSIRMVPIGTTFSKFRRLVRDLSAGLGKEVELMTEGAETELDKTVIEKLDDPLVHLIRNSIDHGIEPPTERKAAGKPIKGTVHLSASHSGPYVFIKIKDDGAGLDAEAIRARALERGLITEEQKLAEDELFDLVFNHGFSTAEDVTSVSGRGVGLDVVTRNIDSLRGTVDIRSEKGAGTAITLRLPLTLAIIEGLLVRIADEHFVVSLPSVEQCIELTPRQTHRRRTG